MKKKIFILAAIISFISFYNTQAQETHSAILINATDDGTTLPLRINDNTGSSYGRQIRLSRANNTNFMVSF